jgi:hypothetical protein
VVANGLEDGTVARNHYNRATAQPFANLTSTSAPPAMTNDEWRLAAYHASGHYQSAMDFSNVAADKLNDRCDTQHRFETIAGRYAVLCPAQRHRNLESKTPLSIYIANHLPRWRISSEG